MKFEHHIIADTSQSHELNLVESLPMFAQKFAIFKRIPVTKVHLLNSKMLATLVSRASIIITTYYIPTTAA